MGRALTWVEISRKNLTHNIRTFKNLVGADKVLCPAVKANAYGHGLKECAPIMVEAGADWLCVNALFEAETLRKVGVRVPIYVMGYVALDDLQQAVEQGFRLVVYNVETLAKLSKICENMGIPALTHLKLETGNYRQGVVRENLEQALGFYKKQPLLKLEGSTTHFSNIEDTTDHSYADFQLKNFREMVEIVEAAGLKPDYKHCANTAATLLFPETHFNFVRTGIGNYGLWPSPETQNKVKNVELMPVMTWKTRVVQLKNVPEGGMIGYGCTYKAPAKMRIAILPVGYYDGYDRRGFSNTSYVLIHGKRAKVCGRVCMNIIMVDVTNIPEVQLEDEVVLLGKQENEAVTAEQLAEWSGTISWEIVAQINERLLRKVV